MSALPKPQPPATHPDGTPTQLGRYRLIRPISSGGMARVFEGRREGLAGVSPRVAVKVILPDYAEDPAFHDLFINEARVGSLVRHQNLVQIQDFDQDGSRYYLVMEYVDGLTLRRVLGLCRKHGVPIPLPVIAEIGRQACDGLQHLHHVRDGHGRSLGLVHRDIKPSNLMVDPQGVVKILDYGVSRALAYQQRDGEVRGTWGYMSPEHAAGDEAGSTSDLFGLASVLFELAAQTPLFPETKPEDIRDLLARDEAARRALRLKRDPEMAPLVPLLVRCFQRDPAARFQEASELGRALGTLVGDPVLARERMVEFLRGMVQLARAGVEGRPMPSREERGAARADGAPRHRKVSQRPSAQRERARAHRSPPSQSRESVVGYVLLAVAALIVGFTAWRLITHEPPAPRADLVNIAPSATLSTRSAVAAKVSGEASLADAPIGTPEVAPAAAATPTEPPAPASTPPAAPEPTSAASPSASSAAAPASSAAVEGKGLLTVSALTRAQVYIDGSLVRSTPLFQHELASGPHTITLKSDDGRSATFSLTVPADGEARAVWDFDSGRLVDQR